LSWLELNADLGEGVGDDGAMLDIVSSASIACGGHAGDDASMRTALRAAKARGARLVIINRDPTPLDAVADAIISHTIGESLAAIETAMTAQHGLRHGDG